MKCPGCGLYLPAQYDQCVSCGTRLDGTAGTADTSADNIDTLPDDEQQAQAPTRRSKSTSNPLKSSVPTMLGILMAVTVLLVSAGATIFMLTKPPDEERLFTKGKRELANGQFAFAVKTLEQASALRRDDPKVYLALARAYVGVDQVEKAWDAISQALQLGMGVAEEPTLASDLANYYRKLGKYDRAIDLLRPLAKNSIPGKRAELADLDAAWGDEALRNGQVELALRCWEEVRDLREGSRFSEAESRLATCYQKLASRHAANREDDKALKYLSKLNTIAQNAKNYELASDIYDRTGQLELAIDQLRKAMKMSNRNPIFERKLASLLSRRGKELLDSGDTDAGYGYLQQAKSIDPTNAIPDVTLKNLTVGFEGRMPRLSGEVWNPSETPINALTIKVELCDSKSSRVLWQKEQKIVDEFVPPLVHGDAKSFDYVANVPVASGQAEFKVYLDGSLYKSYTVGTKEDTKETSTASSGGADEDSSPSPLARFKRPSPASTSSTPPPRTEPVDVTPPPVSTEPKTTPVESSSPVVTDPGPPANKGKESSEEKTMKELDY